VKRSGLKRQTICTDSYNVRVILKKFGLYSLYFFLLQFPRDLCIAPSACYLTNK
jgi:hypothetical protein